MIEQTIDGFKLLIKYRSKRLAD